MTCLPTLVIWASRKMQHSFCWLYASQSFTAFRQVKKNNSYFADLDGWQVQLLLAWLLLNFSLCKTPLGETWCLGTLYFLLTGCIRIQFFNSPLTQSVRPPMVTYPSLCSTCVTYRTSCHAIGHQVLPTQPLPTEEEDFPRGERHFKRVPPLKRVIYHLPKGVYW